MNKKIAMFTIAMVLLLGITMGVTFALMTAESQTVTNTFVAGKFGDLTLDESKVITSGINYIKNTTDTARIQANEYTIVPGASLYKDPAVSFSYKDGAVTGAPYYVYVELTGTGWTISGSSVSYSVTYTPEGSEDAVTENVLSFTVDTDWTVINDTAKKVFVYEGTEAQTANLEVANTGIIANNIVTVNPTLTDAGLAAFTSSTADKAALNFLAYAVQANSDGAQGTWDASPFATNQD